MTTRKQEPKGRRKSAKAAPEKLPGTKAQIEKSEIASLPVRSAVQPQAAQPGPKTIYVSFSAEITMQTTEALLGVLAQQSAQGIERVYLMLSTPGGQVNCGINIYNVLRAMPFHLITHNVGNVDSIGNVVFLAGEERYACPHSTFMFHGVGFDMKQPFRLEEKSLTEHLQSLQADQSRIAEILKERTNLDPKEVNRLFFQAQTKDAAYARAHGIVNDVRDVQIPPGNPILQLVFQR